ncbi:hypothetical protein [Verminephrobacter aporrectodeae]|nr:hypothetical protein [Verminephrobacter aporrectodeae]
MSANVVYFVDYCKRFFDVPFTPSLFGVQALRGHPSIRWPGWLGPQGDDPRPYLPMRMKGSDLELTPKASASILGLMRDLVEGKLG